MGGGGGVVGSGVLEELAGRYAIRSYHRTPIKEERGKVEFVPGDLHQTERFPELVKGVDAVVNLVWYRQPGPDRLYARTAKDLLALLEASRAGGVHQFVQVSLPPAPPELEARTPYLRRRREFESALQDSGLKVTLIQPSAIFAHRDRLVHVMLELMRRYGRFPLFGEGDYHISPIWHRDVGWLVGEALDDRLKGTVLAGGPERFTYLELLELLQRSLGRRVRWVKVSRTTGRWAVRFFNSVGWHVLFTYEYDWLLSDMLGFSSPPHPGREFQRLEPFLREEPAGPHEAAPASRPSRPSHR